MLLRWSVYLYLQQYHWQCVRHAGAVSSGMQCQQFLDKSYKEDVILCLPGVKHVWDLNVTSNTYFNVQQFILYTLEGLLCQDYFPEKFRTNQTQNSNLKQCISWGLGDWHPHDIKFMIIPLVGIRTCRVYIYFIYSIYRVIQEEFALLWEMIVWVILSKKVHTNMGPILNGCGVMTAWNLE